MPQTITELVHAAELVAIELGYKACEHGMNLLHAQERLREIQLGKRSPEKFFEGYQRRKDGR